LSEFDLQSVRQGIAFVSQDASILNDTVYKNISFAKEGATREEVTEALRNARAIEFVESLPQGLDTVLGERGLKLSGGQRQRLSLARAFVKKAPIMVLDEPTSALDSEVEQDIQRVLEDMRTAGDTTVIIIAHRLSTIRNADKIFVLSHGRVVDEGTHEELLKSRSWYADMIFLQTDGKEQ
jgi:ABC-type multidrug transport system fused ATPase/permease subunit